jgi:hypothetical protein
VALKGVVAGAAVEEVVVEAPADRASLPAPPSRVLRLAGPGAESASRLRVSLPAPPSRVLLP